MARKGFVLTVAGTVLFFFCCTASADVPHMINYQGKLVSAEGGCLNDTVSMTFTIYSDDQGTVVDWTETQNSVIVKEGIFNVLLGSVVSIPASIFDGSIKYLGVQVESDPEMRPLKPIVSVAYAYKSFRADTADYARAQGPSFITPVTIYTGNGPLDFTVYDASSVVPVGATCVISEAEAGMGGPDGGGDTQAHIKIRKDDASPAYVLLTGRAAGTGDVIAWSSQGIFPITPSGTFEYAVEDPGFSYGCTIRLIGYY